MISLLAALAAPALAQVFDQPTEAGDALVLDLRSGASIRIEPHDEPRLIIETSGWDGPPDVIELTKLKDHAADSAADWRFISGSAWRLLTELEDPEEGTGLHLAIKVPPGMAIGIRSAGGSITADGLSGSLEGSTGAGPIKLENLRSARIDLSTGAGEVRLRASVASGLLKTSAGNIFLDDVEGDVIALAPIGNVHRRRVRAATAKAAAAARPIDLEHESGHLEIDRIPAGGRLHTGSGNVKVNEAHGPLEIYSGAGHIRVGRLHGGGDLTARAGELVVGLARPTGAAPIPIRLRSDAGGLTLRIPRGVGFRITGQVLWNSRRSPPTVSVPFPFETVDDVWRQPRRPGQPRVDRVRTVTARSGDQQLEIDFEIAGYLKIELVDPAPTLE